MTTINEDSIIAGNSYLPSTEENIYIPQQLIEANELLNSINRRLEDCALEWQAGISRQQWKIINSKIIGENSYEHCLLARTYFSEKSLDEAFQHLLSYNKIFSKYLKNFIALLHGEQSVLNIKETCDAQNQCPDTSEKRKTLNDSNIEPIHFSSIKNQYLNETSESQNFVNNILVVQNSFADVIKAKVNFDTKFLGFEAVLHKTTSFPIETVCLRQYCSKTTISTHGRHKKLKNINVNKKDQIITKPKRLTRSTKSFFKKREIEEPSISIGDTGDQPIVGTNTSFC